MTIRPLHWCGLSWKTPLVRPFEWLRHPQARLGKFLVLTVAPWAFLKTCWELGIVYY